MLSNCRSFWLTPVPMAPCLLFSLLFFIELCKYWICGLKLWKIYILLLLDFSWTDFKTKDYIGCIIIWNSFVRFIVWRTIRLDNKARQFVFCKSRAKNDIALFFSNKCKVLANFFGIRNKKFMHPSDFFLKMGSKLIDLLLYSPTTYVGIAWRQQGERPHALYSSLILHPRKIFCSVHSVDSLSICFQKCPPLQTKSLFCSKNYGPQKFGKSSNTKGILAIRGSYASPLLE